MNIIAGSEFSRRLTFWIRRLLRDLGTSEPLSALAPTGIADADRIQAVYIINLDRQPVRWANFVDEALRHRVEGGLPLMDFCRRVSAVDGRIELPKDEVSCVERSYPLEAQYYVDPDPRLLPKIREEAVRISLTREQIAVALSHIRAWRQMLADGVRYALFLEDDVFFDRTFSVQLNRTWRELPRRRSDGAMFDMLYLSYREVDRGAERTSVSPNLLRFRRGYWWLSGYVLSFSGVIRILKMLPVIGPVDLWVNHLCSALDVYSTPSSIVSQRTDIGSDNRYSILPLLSQIGVQADSSHVDLENLKGRHPVFCIGFPPLDAHVLDVALSLLGYRCCYDAWGRFSESIGLLLENNLPLLFDAYVGVACLSNAFIKLNQLYPEAVFIIPKVPAEGNELSGTAYNRMRNYFSSNPHRLLAIDVRTQGAWRSLCRFLSCKPSRDPFPRDVPATQFRPSTASTFVSIPIDMRPAHVLEHDVHPWIVPYGRLPAFGVPSQRRTRGERTGIFMTADDGSDGIRWESLTDSFPSNLSMFRKENIIAFDGGGFRILLHKQRTENKDYSSGSLASARLYRFGRFEATLRPAKADGVITAFFLHRNNPWQEIDVEFLGRDTAKMLTNVYFNPGEEGGSLNYGNRGTPILIELSFDAADDYHRYAIEWEPHEMRWFVDDHLVHARAIWEPTPLPSLPMRLYINTWPPSSTELAGELKYGDIPVYSDIKDIRVSNWAPNLIALADSEYSDQT